MSIICYRGVFLKNILNIIKLNILKYINMIDFLEKDNLKKTSLLELYKDRKDCRER